MNRHLSNGAGEGWQRSQTVAALLTWAAAEDGEWVLALELLLDRERVPGLEQEPGTVAAERVLHLPM
jgi:hypothetical protein